MASDAAAAPKETMRRDYVPPAFLAPKLDIFVRLSGDGKDVTVGARTTFAANPEYIARTGMAEGAVPALQLDVDLKHVDVQAVRVNGKEIAADAITKDKETSTLTVSAAALADAAPEALAGGEFVVETVNKQNPVENLVSLAAATAMQRRAAAAASAARRSRTYHPTGRPPAPRRGLQGLLGLVAADGCSSRKRIALPLYSVCAPPAAIPRRSSLRQRDRLPRSVPPRRRWKACTCPRATTAPRWRPRASAGSCRTLTGPTCSRSSQPPSRPPLATSTSSFPTVTAWAAATAQSRPSS